MTRRPSFGDVRTGNCTFEEFHELFPELKRRFEEGGSLHPLKLDPPCFHCMKLREKHINDQCFLAATYFTRPPDDEFFYYAVFGYFKGRHA